MPTMCGELKELESPVGGGVSTQDVRYVDRSTGTEVKRRTLWTKHRMVFPRIRIGDQTLEKVFVASDGLGREIAPGARLGDQVCLTVYGHLLTRKVIIGLRSRSGSSFVMPQSGLTSGLVLVRGVLASGAPHPRSGGRNDCRNARGQAGHRPGVAARGALRGRDELVQWLPSPHGLPGARPADAARSAEPSSPRGRPVLSPARRRRESVGRRG